MSRTLAGILAFLLCVGIAVSLPQQAPVADSTAQIEGVVLDTITGRPISGVVVQSRTFYQGRTTTKDDGKFVLLGLPSGTHRIVTAKDGYAAARPAGRRTPGNDGIPLNVGAGQILKDVTIRLVPGGVVTGTILDTRGNPVENANALLQQREPDFLNRFSEDIPRPAFFAARTNDRGEYRFFGVAAGDYYLHVEMLGGPLSQPAGETPLEIYYPGVDEFSKARTISIKSGEEQRLGVISMPLARTFPVHIRIVNETGETPGFRGIQIDRTGASTTARSYGGADAIEIPGLAPGSHAVSVSWPTPGGMAFGQMTVQVGSDEVRADLVVKKGALVRGRVVLETPGNPSRPLRDVSVRFEPRLNVPVSLQNLDPATSDDGTFSIASVPMLDYQLKFDDLPPNTYVQSATMGGRDVLAQNARITGESDISIVVAPSAGAIEGTIKNSRGEKVPGAFVVLVPDQELRHIEARYRTASSDQDGKFALRGAAPGRYKVFAWMELSGPDYLLNSFMQKFEARGISVEAVLGKPANVEVTLADEGAEQ